MTIWDDANAMFAPAFAAFGIWLPCSTVLPGHTKPAEFYCGFERADVNPITGMQSADYEMKYQYKDAPTLVEGAEVIVEHPTGAVLYRVRQAPEVRADSGSDGFFRCAYLTRADDCPS